MFINLIKQDCEVLLSRSLVGKQIVAFGEDGQGRYGKSDRPFYFTIKNVAVRMFTEDDGDLKYGEVVIELNGYDSNLVGHICTDKNFMISLGSLLAKDHIDRSCLSYGAIEAQGDNDVCMELDIAKLLDWA